MLQNKLIKVGDEIFEIASEEAKILTEYIHKVWVKSGKPTSLEGPSGWQVVDCIMQTWAAGYPQEFLEWKQMLADEQSAERNPHDALKQGGGYVPASYPMRIFHMLRVYFKNEKLQDRKFILKLIARYPYLKITKYKI